MGMSEGKEEGGNGERYTVYVVMSFRKNLIPNV